MKVFIVILIVFTSMHGFAQNGNSNHVRKQVKTPKIVSLLPLDTSVTEDNIEVKFVDVIQDSRCPKGVQCMWQGEIKVKIEVTNHNAAKPKPMERVLVLSPIAKFDDLFGNIFHADGFNITALDVKPYPVSEKDIRPEEYTLQFHVQR